MPEIELSLYTPFGPKRGAWELLVWTQALRNLGLKPPDTKLILVDNTGEDLLSALEEYLKTEGWKIIRVVDEEYLPEGSRGPVIGQKMRRLMEQAQPHFEGRYVLSLESDVLPPLGSYASMRAVLEAEATAGCCAIVAHSRQGRAMTIYEIVDGDVERFRLRTMKREKAGSQAVGSVHLACTLYRASFLAETDMTKGWDRGWDFSLVKRLYAAGLQPWVSWDHIARHYRSAKEAV